MDVVADDAQLNPVLFVLAAHGGADQRHGLGRLLFASRLVGLGGLALIEVVFEQVLDEDEPLAGLAERLGRLLAADAEDVEPLFADAAGEAREVAVRGHQDEAVEAPGVQEIHGVDDQRDVGRVLAFRVGELLVREHGEVLEFLVPATQLLVGEVAVDPSDAGFAERGHLLEDRFGPGR